MSRRIDWVSQLEGYLASCRGRVFAYGAFDCALFVAGAIEAMTGDDWAAEIRGAYGSRAEVLALARARTGRGIVRRLVEHVLSGRQELRASLAQRGDVVLVQRARGRSHSVGLVALDGRHILAVARSGVVRLPMHLAVKAWRV